MPRLHIAASSAVLLAVGLTACGGSGDSKTVVETVTRDATTTQAADPATSASGPSGTAAATGASGPSGTAAATGASGAAGADAPPPGPALPDGRATVSGSYEMSFVKYAPPGYNLTYNSYAGAKSTWHATTTCAAGVCRVTLRRALEGGGFKTYVLREIAPGKFGATVTAVAKDKSECVNDRSGTPVRERASIQAAAKTTLGNIPTVTRIDAYVVQTGRCRKGDSLGTDRIHGTATWRGRRTGN